MSKNILVIKGSCRRDSFTNKILNNAFEGIENIELTVFDTYAESFAFCNGCNYCENAGKCVNRDLDDFFYQFENADLVVFASPVYNGGYSAPIKALIDRFQVYYTAFYKNGKVQPIKKHRKGILLVASGRGGAEATANMEKNLRCAFTILNMSLEGTVLCANTDTVPDYENAVNNFKSVLKRSL